MQTRLKGDYGTDHKFTFKDNLFELLELINYNLWKYGFIFILEDITPPKLTFINAPTVSLDSVYITWTFDEDVVAQTCTLQTPASSSIVRACNNSWSDENLKEGIHNLYINAKDIEGNVSPSSKHTWRVRILGR